MRNNMLRARFLILLPVCVLAGACGLLPDAYSGCDKPKPYQTAQDLPPLRVPDGAVLPDTRNAMHIPTVNAPQIPASAGRCLDHPPSYGTKPATG
ncbi:MAG: hypothetical protein WBO00_05285 [Steroidobacteraceae bacterium]